MYTFLFGLVAALAVLPSSINADVAEQFGDSSASFALDIYNQVIQEAGDENVIISPFSIQTAAAFVYAGAAGKTAEDMVKGLKLLSSDKYAVASSFKNFLELYQNCPILKIANKIYLQNGFEVKKEFSDIIQQYFYSDAQNVDFAKSEQTANLINDWVSQKTNGKITNLVPADALSILTRSFITNAIYFKGRWEREFRKELTTKMDFHLNENDVVQVDMMHTVADMRFAPLDSLDANAIELPFKNSTLSFVAIVPRKYNGFKELERKLLQTNLKDVHNSFFQTKVSLFLPRFTATFKTKLKDAFQNLGMSSMFSNANFTNISDDYLEVSDIYHKAFIEVNEEGAEAAAATGVGISLRTGPINVVCDRPFIYCIKGKDGETYFFGRYLKPQNDIL